MKTLSLIQPWASLVVDNRKPIETRSWFIKYRGILAIHASSKVDKEACARFGYKWFSGYKDAVPRSAVLGVVILYDCVRFPSPSAPPDVYGDFTPGRYGWLLKDVVKFEKPIPAKGHLGLWEWIQ